MAYLPSSSLGADELIVTPVPPDVLARLTSIDARMVQILEHQRKDTVRWKWQMVAAIAGSIFAAAKLGIIAVPHVRAFRRERRRSR